MSILDNVLLKLCEGAAQVKKQFVDSGKIPLATFNELKRSDPTEQNKYLLWMVKQQIANPDKTRNIIKAVQYFQKATEAGILPSTDVDIYQKDLEGVKVLLKKLSVVKDIKSKEITKRRAVRGAEVVHEDDKVIVYRMTNFEAFNTMCGGKSNWCTSKHRKDWDSYEGRGITFYFVIDKQKEELGPEKSWYAVEVAMNKTRRVWDWQNKQSFAYEEMKKRIGVE